MPRLNSRSASVSAPSLQLHPDVTFVIDEQAASRLKHKQYYRRVMEMTALLDEKPQR